LRFRHEAAVAKLTTFKFNGAANPKLLLDSRILFCLQAADLLAAEEHVKDVCSALATRLFSDTPTSHSSTECVSAQVHLHEHVTSMWILVDELARMMNILLHAN
jgi:hypothetical protein